MKTRQKLSFTAILLVLTLYLGVAAIESRAGKQDLVFPDSLDLVAVTVDGNALTLSELAFYIAFQESKIEEDARIYNPENTGEYWNVYTNKTFVREEGKQIAMQMAVHDEIFYQLARAEGMELDEEDGRYLANSQYDFWSDLTDSQKERLGVGEEAIKESMRKAALAQKYQNLLAEMTEERFSEYEIAGAAYEKLLAEHVYVVDEAVWNRVHFGEVSLKHRPIYSLGGRLLRIM